MIGRLNDQPNEQAELDNLCWHWDLAYEINFAGGTWTARFLAGTGTLSASSAEDLRRLIRTDYASRKAVGASGGGPAGTGGIAVGAGEQALRRLRDEGVI